MERGNDPIEPAAAASALQWWQEAGVDVLVDEAPRDWLRPKAKPTPVQASAAPAAEALPDQLELFQAHLRDSAALPFASASAGNDTEGASSSVIPGERSEGKGSRAG